MPYFKQYLPKPRRGRTAAGTVHDWAMKFGVTENILRACEHSSQLHFHVLNTPVYTGYLGVCAGMCGHNQFYIELHDVILAPDLFETEGRATFLHEIGHLIDEIERGDSDHSRRWKQVMTRLGRPNEDRCHTLPRSKMRSALAELVCNGTFGRNQVCGNVERTSKPERYSGRKCSWCDNGRLVYNPKT